MATAAMFRFMCCQWLSKCCTLYGKHSTFKALTANSRVYTMAKTDKINISHKTPLLCRPKKSYNIVIDKVQKSLTAYNASLAAFAKSCLAIFLSFNPKRAPLKFLWLYSKWSPAKPLVQMWQEIGKVIETGKPDLNLKTLNHNIYTWTTTTITALHADHLTRPASL